MKLVDILAQELKEWLDEYRWIEFDGANGCYADVGVGYKTLNIDCSSCTEGGLRSITVTRKQWQAAVDALKSESPSLHIQMLGRAYRLPEVGATAFVYDPEGELVYGAGESGEVLAHVENTAVIRMSYGLGCFTGKHLRTAEQIKAEERATAISEIAKASGLRARDGAQEVAKQLYDAGYRKFKIVEGE